MDSTRVDRVDERHLKHTTRLRCRPWMSQRPVIERASELTSKLRASRVRLQRPFIARCSDSHRHPSVLVSRETGHHSWLDSSFPWLPLPKCHKCTSKHNPIHISFLLSAGGSAPSCLPHMGLTNTSRPPTTVMILILPVRTDRLVHCTLPPQVTSGFSNSQISTCSKSRNRRPQWP